MDLLLPALFPVPGVYSFSKVERCDLVESARATGKPLDSHNFLCSVTLRSGEVPARNTLMNPDNLNYCQKYAENIEVFVAFMAGYIAVHGESAGDNISQGDLKNLEQIAAMEMENKDESKLFQYLHEDLQLALVKIDNETDTNRLHQLVFETSHCIQGFASAVKDAAVYKMLTSVVKSAEDVAQWKDAVLVNLAIATSRNKDN